MLADITALLIALGPWIVFVVVLAETAIFVGLLLPAEATVLLAAFLAFRGVFPVEQILAATFFGGLIGDQVGYALGRYGGRRVVGSSGWAGRTWGRWEAAASILFQRRAALSVTLARFIGFVRTLMPWFAGMSRMSYGRFLAYDVVGVAGWAVGSVALGYLAGESWRVAADAVGAVTAALVAVAGLAGLAVWLRRRAAAAAGR
jgi:membrane-associated protein